MIQIYLQTVLIVIYISLFICLLTYLLNMSYIKKCGGEIQQQSYFVILDKHNHPYLRTASSTYLGSVAIFNRLYSDGKEFAESQLEGYRCVKLNINCSYCYKK